MVTERKVYVYIIIIKDTKEIVGVTRTLDRAANFVRMFANPTTVTIDKWKVDKEKE